ncbi:hypothetical protein NG99_23240 [Erwinia typographi]|uniref:DNA polymerase V n=1 Tax=Erwinia typographi TaxID=371042 RepID=A0A0A3YPM9_9GAMM|nr:hypothetical protein [Erwinia typographi]KGT87464.1 hypothetical protein NG99_23240 [Erwinia typographi]
MARIDDIHNAFNDSIKVEPSGRRTVATTDFVRELHRHNHDFSLREANIWIEHYQCCFRDITPHEGEARIFYLMNMGYVR